MVQGSYWFSPLRMWGVWCLARQRWWPLYTLFGFFASSNLQANMIVESDSMNAISQVSSFAKVSWRFQFYFNEIKHIFYLIHIKFQHVGRAANSFADALVKQRGGQVFGYGCFDDVAICLFGIYLLYNCFSRLCNGVCCLTVILLFPM